MRLERLTLERYGHFEGRTLELDGDGVRLHVVFGPNEAGKSTVLAAVGDLLFGFPHRTPYAFRWDTSDLRLSATVTNGKGERLAFGRRKGRGRTLLSDTGAELPEATLAAYLGSADRDLFDRMFGLDHAGLRQGGEAMLKANGDLAQSLFEAGSGLRQVKAARERIEQELDRLGDLGARKSGTKPLWQAAERFAASQKRMRVEGLRGEEWHEAQLALDAARAERARLGEEQAGLRRRRAQLSRIRRVGPILRTIADREALRAALSPLAARLPESFEAEWLAADAALQEADRDRTQGQCALADLIREAAEAPAPLGFESRREEIEALHVKLGEFEKDRADEPKLARDLAAKDRLVEDYLRQLGLPPDPGSVEARMPSAVLVARLRDLIATGTELRVRLESLRPQARDAHDKVKAAREAELATPAPPADPSEPEARIAEAAALGDVAARLAQAQQDHDRAERELGDALARLAPWEGSAEDLAARPAPASALVAQFAQRRRDIGSDQAEAGRRHREAEAGLHEVGAQEEALGRFGEIPSTAAVQASRDRRDEAWRQLRVRFDGSAGAVDPASDGEAVAAYETFVRHADELVDRREAEGDRLRRLTELTLARATHAARRDAAALDGQRAQAALGAVEAEWRALWAGLLDAPAPPEAMGEWLRSRDEALRLLDLRRSAVGALDLASRSAALYRDHLMAAAGLLGLSAIGDEGSTVLARRVRLALTEVRSAWAAATARASALAESEARATDLAAELADAEAALEAWRRDWQDALAELGLRPDAGTAEAEVALGLWQSIRERWTSRAQTRSRLDGLRRDLSEFRLRLDALLTGLGAIAFDLDREEPAQTMRGLHSRLGEDLLRIAAASKLSTRVTEAERRSTEAQTRLIDATDHVLALRRRHGLSEETDALAAAAEAGEWRRLGRELAEKREELRRAGDALAEAALREEAAEISVDQCVADLEALEREEERVGKQAEAAAQAESAADLALRALEGRAGAGDAAQEMRHAGNAVGDLANRWMRLEAARRLLKRAMDRYRAENENPLLRRASELFRLIAQREGSAWERLEVRHDDAPTLVALRTDGSPCGVEGLSEGTRDQLFLALRLAAIERHVADHGSLPFLADDLFVTSDDRRLVPGLAALAELGRTVQVILFTHHAHVLDAALATLPAGAVREHRL